MTVTIQNNKTPQYATRDPFAEFRIILRRSGEKITLEIPQPKCHRDFHNFTGAEKDAYNAIVAHVVDTAGAALRVGLSSTKGSGSNGNLHPTVRKP